MSNELLHISRIISVSQNEWEEELARKTERGL